MARSDIPSTYAHASRIDADGRAVFAGARLIWEALTPTMQSALIGSCRSRSSAYGWCLVYGAAKPTRQALADRGLVVAGDVSDDLTPLGLMVREAGTRTGIGQGSEE